MAFDLSGTYTRAHNWTADKAAHLKISASRMDEEDDAIATALNLVLLRDGRAAMTADQPAGGFKHTNVAVADARTQYGRVSQIQDGAFTYLGTTTGTDTIVATASPAITAYIEGQQFCFEAGGTNAGAATININGVGAIAVQYQAAALVASDITANDMVYGIIRDAAGTKTFQMVSSPRTKSFTKLTINTAGLYLKDTDASHSLVVTVGSNLTTDRVFTITTGDAARTLDISAANVTISATAANILDDTSNGAIMTTLGITAAAQSILDDTSNGAIMTTLGITAAAQSILDDTTVGAIGTTLNLGTGSASQFARLGLGAAADGTVLLTLSSALPASANQMFAKGDAIAHGMTSVVATSVYFYMLSNDTTGGSYMVGLNGNGSTPRGFTLAGYVTTANATHTTSGDASVRIFAGKKSGTGVGAHSAGDNLVAFYDNAGGTMEGAIAAGGTLYLHTGGASPTDFDEHDDGYLLHALTEAHGQRATGPQLLMLDSIDALTLPSIHEDEDGNLVVGDAMENTRVHSRIATGGMNQLRKQIEILTAVIEEALPGVLAQANVKYENTHGESPGMVGFAHRTSLVVDPVAIPLMAEVDNAIFDMKTSIMSQLPN